MPICRSRLLEWEYTHVKFFSIDGPKRRWMEGK